MTFRQTVPKCLWRPAVHFPPRVIGRDSHVFRLIHEFRAVLIDGYEIQSLRSSNGVLTVAYISRRSTWYFLLGYCTETDDPWRQLFGRIMRPYIAGVGTINERCLLGGDLILHVKCRPMPQHASVTIIEGGMPALRLSLMLTGKHFLFRVSAIRGNLAQAHSVLAMTRLSID